MRISDWSSDVCSSDLGAEHRGQYIVEIMRDAARELADRLHLRRLRDLALEARFLARILEAEQHRRLAQPAHPDDAHRSEEHTSELQSLMRISYAVFCLKKKKKKNTNT